ncbi:MAG: ATP-binding cassette domain-containing protein [Proteobacteria bacterium]|nr:ATP-binding cassette domain-containing protein [Pseudomonadota bacterium]
MSRPLLHLRDIHLTFGGTPLLAGAEIAVAAGDRICLVGRNGSGKSTLLKIAAGLVEPESGEVFIHPGATVRYLPQEPDFSGFSSTLAYVEAGMAAGDDHYRARYLLESLGLSGDEDPARLSGGEARRAALARVLAPEPDILLLDEPTNHLDLPAIEWLEGELQRSKSAIVLISHDRRFLETLSRTTVWLDRGTTRRMDDGFGRFEAWRDAVLEEEERDQHKLERKIAMEMDWLRYGVTARRKRNVRRLGLLKDMRKEHREHRFAQGNVKMAAQEGESSAKVVIEARNIAKSFDEARIVRDFSTRIARGDRIGIVGPNGAGKTTLLSLLTGTLAPDSGSVKIGQNVAMVTLDQRRESLDPTATVADTLTGGRSDLVMIDGQPKHVIGYMKDFLFMPEQARTPVTALSGGERGRLMLARALAKPSNLLVLDEPTNDLDLETLDLLQELLAEYSGTLILISHDRDFLDRVVTSVIVSEPDGKWQEYAGGYSDMLLQGGRSVQARGKEQATERSRPAEPAAKTEAAAAAQAPARRRLSPAEQHALKTLPAEIDKLTAEIAMLQGAVNNPTLYAKDPGLFTRATTRLGAAQQELAAAEDRWLELEMIRAEAEG